MVPFVENLLRDGTSHRNFRKALFSEKTKIEKMSFCATIPMKFIEPASFFY